MKLSIITVNLNNSSGLQKTIESVISQTTHDFEYIIIDGGSIDGSVDIIQSYTDIPEGVYCNCNKNSTLTRINYPISYWISEADKGIYHAMNKGIHVSKGEYCQFLNSGDCLASKDIIERIFASNYDCNIVYGNMLKQFPQGKAFRDSGLKGNFTMLSFYRGTLNHSSAFIKRSLFEKYGFYDENLQIVSDWKWYLIAIGIYNEQIQYINLDVSLFDMTGISNSNLEVVQKERRKVLEEIIPANILADYDSNWENIEMVNRLKHYKITQWLFVLSERILFKWENIMTPGNIYK